MGYHTSIQRATATNVCGNDDDDGAVGNDDGCDGGDGEDVCYLNKLAPHFCVLWGPVEGEDETIIRPSLNFPNVIWLNPLAQCFGEEAAA